MVPLSNHAEELNSIKRLQAQGISLVGTVSLLFLNTSLFCAFQVRVFCIQNDLRFQGASFWLTAEIALSRL